MAVLICRSLDKSSFHNFFLRYNFEELENRVFFWKGGYFKSIKEMKVLRLLCRAADRQESCQMAQIVCPILLVCNSGSHHKMSISLIFLTSVHQVRRYEKLVSKTRRGIPWLHKPTEVWQFLVRLRKHFDHILRRGVKKNIICFCMTCLQPEIVCDGENKSLSPALLHFLGEHSEMTFTFFQFELTKELSIRGVILGSTA